MLEENNNAEETNDRIRGKGVYRKLIKTSVLLKNRQVEFGYKMSVNKLNVGEVESFAVEAAKLGAVFVEYSHMHPTPDLVKHDMILPYEKWRGVDVEVARLKKILRIFVVMCAGGYTEQAFYQCSSMQMADYHIDCHGNLALCCILPYYESDNPERAGDVIAGNLAETDLWDAHKRLVSIIARLNQSKIRKIKEGNFREIDHYPCMYCLRYFERLNWLKKMEPDSEWVREEVSPVRGG